LGAARTLEALRPEGPWGWGVATVEEGLALRATGAGEPVLITCPVAPSSLEAALGGRLDLTVSSLEALDAVARAARSTGADARIHVDVDTGMGRSGFDWKAAAAWLPRVREAATGRVRWVGLQTHLHSAEDDAASVDEQCARLETVLSCLGDAGPDLVVHVLNSPGTFRVPAQARGAVRPGIFLYGGRIGPELPAPEPVFSLHARVVHVREASEGDTLGYGATHRAAGPERWATLAIGYGDGLPRALGNRGSALVGGARVPIIGRISMDLTVVDITHVPGVGVGDVATLVGADSGETITLDEVAELAGTISYEILTGFGPRLPRIWTGLDGA
ncbi:MAG TPA: alanine racemase, partial [Longimicrobiales bacterium]|nr:alanine racemase [Longimicrobiales bacterium]